MVVKADKPILSVSDRPHAQVPERIRRRFETTPKWAYVNMLTEQEKAESSFRFTYVLDIRAHSLLARR